MSNVSSYYSQPYGTSLPVQPRPTVSSNGNGTYNVGFNVNPDAYTSTGAAIALQAAPHVPGAMAGYQAKEGIVDGMRRARTIRNARYRSRAYGGRYGTSRSYKGKSAVGSGGGTMFSGLGKAIKSSVLWGAAISVGLNGYKVFKKEQTISQAASAVAGDVTSAAVGGAAGATASAIATPILAGMFGPASLLVTLGGIGVGIGGYMVADHFLRKTNFFQQITSKTQAIVAKVTG